MFETIPLEAISSISNLGISGIFVYLWWTERSDRKRAEQREREVLRDAADLKPESVISGGS
jgi:hypothetical protein